MAFYVPKPATNFSVPDDDLKIWLNDFNNRFLIHFRQASSDPKSKFFTKLFYWYITFNSIFLDPKKHYVFTTCTNIASLCGLCETAMTKPDFKKRSIEMHKTDAGACYVLELVKECDYFMLQSRNVE